MSDVLNKKQRSYCMSRIRGKDTNPEMVVRRAVHSLGYRYRLHRRDLPGKPDLVFSSRRKIIFVHGCFWHRHDCRYGRVTPKTRAEFWRAKIEGNVGRDRRNHKMLEDAKWDVLYVWECETKDLHRLLVRLDRFLG